mmetsp:Transcript_5835/g.10325  ORF Transcript_5835/g.10325 Transcript_5835/m.10325 type:complete len:198 (-) Transcript_5835:3162-3755(-)
MRRFTTLSVVRYQSVTAQSSFRCGLSVISTCTNNKQIPFIQRERYFSEAHPFCTNSARGNGEHGEKTDLKGRFNELDGVTEFLSSDKQEETAGEKSANLSGIRIGEPRLLMSFTCAKCETRSTKSFAKSSYQNGVVLIRCPGCEALHLIADNLGWFGDEKNIEEILAKKKASVSKYVAYENDEGNLEVRKPKETETK